MGRFPQKKGEKGSQKWIQILVNRNPDLLNDKIRSDFDFHQAVQIEWLSPLASDGYAEYRDQAFLDRLGITTKKLKLKQFWPRGGPQWDALGQTEDGRILLVEAKSHISEILTHVGAKSQQSLTKINESLNRTKSALNIKTSNDWSSPFYQCANRIAHLYFLRELNRIPTYLIFLYFLNDETVEGTRSRDEWLGAIRLVNSYLGIKRTKITKYITDLFLETSMIEGRTNRDDK